MRILIVTICVPWPLTYGGNSAQFSTLKSLSDDHDFTVLAPAYNPEQLAAFDELRNELPNVRLISVPLFDVETPAPNSKPRTSPFRWIRKAGRKIYGLVRGVTVRPVNSLPAALPPKARAPLPYWDLDDRIIAAVSREGQGAYDLVQVEFADYLPVGLLLPARMPKLFIHHQVHFQFMKRFTEARGSEDEIDRYHASMAETMEIALLHQFDGIVTFSDFDRMLLTEKLGNSDVHCSPFPVPDDVTYQSTCAEFSGSFYYLGGEGHFPNVDALDWMLDEIWPGILSHLPEARLFVIGQWSEAGTIQRSSHKGVEFLGFVGDLSQTMKGGIMLLPLRIGSGIRTKLLASFAAGVPVVSTAIGCEGISVEHGKHIRIADDADSFVTESVRLATQQELRVAQGSEAGLLVEQVYSQDAVRARRNEIYRLVVEKHACMVG